MNRARIYLDVVPWDYRKRNSDWRYVRYLLPRLASWEQSIEFVMQSSKRVSFVSNLKSVRAALKSRIGLSIDVRQRETDSLDVAELRRSKCSAIFSHRGYPINAGDVPVIWQSSLLDAEMLKADPATLSMSERARAEYHAREREIRSECFRRAAAVQVSTQAEAERLGREFPALAGRFRPIPFFLPDLSAVEEELLERHRCPEKVEILFVGNYGWIKGLDLLLEAFRRLSTKGMRRIELTIVSHFDGRRIELPPHIAIKVRNKVSHAEVLHLMSRAHIFVNPARFESYGFAFIEAMSRGVACIGPDWEVQRELLENGRAGVNVRPDVEQIAPALQTLIENDDLRYEVAMRGWLRFQERYAPSIVASHYARLFREIAGA